MKIKQLFSKFFKWLLKRTFYMFLGVIFASIALVLALRWASPPTTTFMLLYAPKKAKVIRKWVPYHKISAHMPIAVVAAEDQKFPNHWGFDFEAIGKAISINQRRVTQRGGSTISQQVAKNLFLWSGKTYFRKGLEAYFTLLIEAMLPKKRILEIYLNIAEFGPGVFGIDAASRSIFHKSPKWINKGEAALLAAVLPNPHQLKARNPSEYVRQRAWDIRYQMDLLGGTGYLRNRI